MMDTVWNSREVLSVSDGSALVLCYAHNLCMTSTVCLNTVSNKGLTAHLRNQFVSWHELESLKYCICASSTQCITQLDQHLTLEFALVLHVILDTRFDASNF